ncbi:MAG TPA: ECF transporter S component [bacterium]|nr:ECF transporter S component [bacterium]HPN43042.1 ECF transporter S component [bacterium]
MTKRTNQMTLSAMFIALGVLLPIVFHSIGLGSIFLPMFWPVAAAAFFLPVSFAALVGILTPLVSFLFTGMPPLSPPILYIMIFELLALSLITSLLYTRTRWGIVWPLVAGLLCSRIVLFFMVIPLASVLGLPPQLASAAYILKGLPGIILIIIVSSLLINRIKHEPIFTNRK